MNWFDGVVLLLLVGSAYAGYQKGLAMALPPFLTRTLGVLLVGAAYDDVFSLVPSGSLSDISHGLIAVAASAAAVAFIYMSVRKAIAGGVEMVTSLSASTFARVDPRYQKGGGAAIGFVQAFALVQLVLMVSAVLPPSHRVSQAIGASLLARTALTSVPLAQYLVPAEFQQPFQVMRGWDTLRSAGLPDPAGLASPSTMAGLLSAIGEVAGPQGATSGPIAIAELLKDPRIASLLADQSGVSSEEQRKLLDFLQQGAAAIPTGQ